MNSIQPSFYHQNRFYLYCEIIIQHSSDVDECQDDNTELHYISFLIKCEKNKGKQFLCAFCKLFWSVELVLSFVCIYTMLQTGDLPMNKMVKENAFRKKFITFYILLSLINMLILVKVIADPFPP